MGTERDDFMSNILKNNVKGVSSCDSGGNGEQRETNISQVGMTVDEIVANFYILLIAGSGTTSTLLTSVTFYLLTNEEVMKKLVKEIRSSFSNEEEITHISVNKLTYQLALINETMRIHPPTPQGGPRIVPGEGRSSVVIGFQEG